MSTFELNAGFWLVRTRSAVRFAAKSSSYSVVVY